MSTIYGQKSTFTGSDNNLRISIEDLIKKYPDYKFPALKRLNGKVFKNEVLSHKYEWSHRDLRPVKTEVVNATVSDSATSFIVADAGVFNKDDILLNKRTDERMLVTAVTGGNNVTVERGFQDSAATAMVEGDIVVRAGVAAAQGALADNGVTPGTDDLFNYTQIFEDVVEMSDTQHKGFVRGDESQAAGIERIQQELMEQLHLNLFLGIRYKNTSTKRTTTGGIKYFTDTYAPDNVVDFGGSGTWSNDLDVINKLEDTVENIATRMGNKPTIYATYGALRKVRILQDDAVRTVKSDKSRGIGVVDTIQSGMGDLDIVQIIDRTTILDDYIFFVDETNVGYKPHKGRGWFTEEKPFAGDGHLWQVVGEYIFKADLPQASLAYLHNLGIS
jgi:hypothetical protein